MKMPWTKEEPETTLEEGEKGTKTELEAEEKKKLESSSDPPPTDTGVETPFDSGPLKGQTAKEVADLIALQNITIKEQQEAAGVAPVAAPVVEPEPAPVEVTSEEFFQNPSKVINDAISVGIQSQMKEIVSELRTDMAVGRAKNAWDDAANAIPNLSTMRPLIEAKLKQNGVSAPNLASIIAVSDMLMGEAQRRGTPLANVAPTTEPTPVIPVENKREIPQHNVSTQPLAPTEKKVEFEPLDENEARIARERKMTHEQYRQWGALEVEDVLKPAPVEQTS